MSGPWERYAQPTAPVADGPWTRYGAPAAAPSRGVGEVAADVGKSALSGLARGAAETAMLPVTVPRLGRQITDAFVEFADTRARQVFGGRQLSEAEQVQRRSATATLDPVGRLLNAGQDAARQAMDANLYAPQTTAGKYARTVGEFIPGALLPGLTIGNALRFGVVPGLASEAAGQATEGTAFEPFARAGAGIAAGVGMAALQRPSTGQQALEQFAGGPVPKAHIDAADALMRDAAARGVQLTPVEALNQVSGGAYSRLAAAQRVIEQSPGGAPVMGPMMAERPGQVQRAGQQAFDQLAPNPGSPSQVGAAAGGAARNAMQATPEGVALNEAVALNAPRTTAGDAGPRMQQGLAGVRDGREGMRAALADVEYQAARDTPGTIPLNGGHRVGTVHSVSEPRSIPILVNDAERAAAQQAALKGASRFDQMPIVGERATAFGQADPRSVLQAVETAMDTAKGAPRQALEAARRALLKPDGTPDFSVAGLDASRKAITDLIDQAAGAGARNTVRELQGVLGQLDDALARVPQYERARSGFEAASKPLGPFQDGKPLGQITQRDQYGREFVMPGDRAPGILDRAGAQGAQEFAENASGGARRAYVDYIVSRIVDASTDAAGNISLDAMRQAMTRDLDTLRQLPEVSERLLAVARARQGFAAVENSKLGEIARAGGVTQQRAVLFPAVPEAGSAAEVGQTVSQMVRSGPSGPKAAADLVGQHARTVFAEATQSNVGGANQFGGAKFAAQIAGNTEQAASLRAAVEALPGGKMKWQGFSNFLDVLRATGRRLPANSATSMNQELQAGLQAGALVGRSATTGGVGFFKEIGRRWDQYQLSGKTEAIADLLTSRNASGVFGRLAKENGATPAAQALSIKLLSIAGQGATQFQNTKAQPVPSVR